jgi:hypothetical protein
VEEFSQILLPNSGYADEVHWPAQNLALKYLPLLVNAVKTHSCVDCASVPKLPYSAFDFFTNLFFLIIGIDSLYLSGAWLQ